jgi:hypothetical protein
MRAPVVMVAADKAKFWPAVMLRKSRLPASRMMATCGSMRRRSRTPPARASDPAQRSVLQVDFATGNLPGD